MSKHYNASRIRHSLLHFLTGKAFTAISTLSVMLLLARALPKADYAVVITLEAIVTLTGMAASFGINQTLLRYIPELRVANNGLALYRLILNAIISRAWVFGLAIIGLAAAGPWLAEWLHFSGRISLLPLFLIAGWTSLMWFLIAQVMESLMWQKTSQYTIAATAALRLTLLGISYSRGEADLERVVWIEVICNSLTLILLLLGTWYNQRQDPHRHSGNLTWFQDNKKRISRYALHGYGFSLSSLLYGSHSNRAISARFLSPPAMGDYGFADSLTNLFRRFLPSALLIGFIRPLYFARYAETKQLHDLERMANLIFRINLVFLSMAALALLFVGKPVLDILTSGKYGDTVYLVAAMLGVLALESLRLQYVLLCQTIEENGILIYSNLILSLSLVFSLPFFPAIGAWAIVLANLVGNILSIIYIHFKFSPQNVTFKLDTFPILSTLLSLVLATGAGYQIQIISNWILAGIVSLIVFATLLVILKSFTNSEIMQFKKLLRKGANNVQPA
ncbi:MAG: oligosaccharide flippase family protein [Sulfuriferula sp.]